MLSNPSGFNSSSNCLNIDYFDNKYQDADNIFSSGYLGSSSLSNQSNSMSITAGSQLNDISTSHLVDDRSKTNLIINYLPQRFDQNDLYKLFETVGPIRQCKLIRDKVTGASLCYGFVDYNSPEHAAQAIQRFHTFETEQKRLRVAYASTGSKSRGQNQSNEIPAPLLRPSPWEVYVAGLPLLYGQSEVAELFSQFGRLLQVRLYPSIDSASLNDLSMSTCCATLIFEDKNGADAALQLNGMQRRDWTQPLAVKLVGPFSRSSNSLATNNFPMRDDKFSLGQDGGSQELFNQRRTQRNNNYNTGLSNSANTDLSCLKNSPLFPSRIDHNDINQTMNDFSNNFTETLDFGSNGHLVSPLSNSLNNYFSQDRTARPIVKGKGKASANLSHLFGINGDTSENKSIDISSLLMNGNLDHPSSVSKHASVIFNNGDDSTIDFSLIDSMSSLIKSEASTSLLHTNSGGLNNAWPSVMVDTSGPSSGVGSASSAAAFSSLQTTNGNSIFIRTPLISSNPLQALLPNNCRVMLKLENTQPSGSFKLRGIGNFCKKAVQSGCTRMVSSSGGNAGLAAAYACTQLGVPLTVVVPESTPEMMRRKIEEEGAIVQIHGKHWAEAHAKAVEISKKSSLDAGRIALVHPYDHPDVWEGHESIVDELVSDLVQPPDVIVVAVGGGGLLNGIIQGLWRNRWTSTSIVAMETVGADCLNQSVVNKCRVTLPEISSLAKSLGAVTISERTWELLQRVPIISATCTDKQAVAAVGSFLDDHAMLVEPACGASLAAIYSGILQRLHSEGKIPRLNSVCVIVCGGRGVSRSQLAHWERQVGLVRNQPPETDLTGGQYSLKGEHCRDPCDDDNLIFSDIMDQFEKHQTNSEFHMNNKDAGGRAAGSYPSNLSSSESGSTVRDQ